MRQLAPLLIALFVAGCALPTGAELTPYHVAVLAGAPYPDLVVEIDHAPGYAPSDEAREHLLAQLRDVTAKERITVVLEQTLPSDANARWTTEELIELERTTRSAIHAAPVAVLHILYPAGEFHNASVAGITITGLDVATVTVFLDTIGRVSTPLIPIPLPPQARSEIERATLLHEVGHAIGLVNNGLAMTRDREDPEHPGHSSNPDSVMYWQVESLAGLREALLHDGSVPTRFDADDLADIRAASGR